MTQETIKKDTTPEGYTRSSYAVPGDLHEKIPAMVDAIGARIGNRKPSVGALLTMLARNQEEAAKALAPLVEKFNASQANGSAAKVARKQLQDKLKGMTPEQVERLLRQVEATPEGAQP